jgi:hypothetical protein
LEKKKGKTHKRINQLKFPSKEIMADAEDGYRLPDTLSLVGHHGCETMDARRAMDLSSSSSSSSSRQPLPHFTASKKNPNPQTLDSRAVELGFRVEESSCTGNFENRQPKTRNLTWELPGNGEL